MILKLCSYFVCLCSRHTGMCDTFFRSYDSKTLRKCLECLEYLLLYLSPYISASKSQKSSSYLATSWDLNRIIHDKCLMHKCIWIIWKGTLACHIFSSLWLAISVHNNDYSLPSLSDVLVRFRRNFFKLYFVPGMAELISTHIK